MIIIFFQNLGTATTANAMVLSSQMVVKSGTVVFFSSMLGGIAAMLGFYGMYFDQVFGKKETVWTGNNTNDVTKTQQQDSWDNTEW